MIASIPIINKTIGTAQEIIPVQLISPSWVMPIFGRINKRPVNATPKDVILF